MTSQHDRSPLLLVSSLGTDLDNDSGPDESSPLFNDREALEPQFDYTELSHISSQDGDPPHPRTFCCSWETYSSLLETHPLLVKSITAFFILGLGDLCGQGVEHLRGTAAYSGVDWPRAARFGTFGLLGAPWAHYYFHFLDHYFPPTPEPFTKTTAIKLLIDQGIQAPALLAVIISALAILKGDGIDGVKHDLSKKYVDALIANWKLWIPASLVNLAFVKPSYRVLYVNIVFFVWTIILSVMQYLVKVPSIATVCAVSAKERKVDI